MRIVMLASEAVPFSKTGGLADVVGALPKALARAGHQVFVLTPYYTRLPSKVSNIKPTGKKVCATIDGKKRWAVIHQADVKEGLTFYLLENKAYFGREHLYQTEKGDYPDNAQRFAFFSRVAMDTILALDLEPDIIHAHDWQAALTLYDGQTKFWNNPVIQKAKRVLTIHNIGYQGLFPKEILKKIDLAQDDFTMDRMEFYGKLNFLKAGIVSADAITTVSPTHAQEMLTKECGFGLEGVLSQRKDRFSGILNGIDYELWNPSNDQHIPKTFSMANLSGKAACKVALQRQLGLPEGIGTPIVGMIGRLTVQKGVDVLCRALPEVMKKKVQLVILGTGEKKYHDMLEKASRDFHDSMRLTLAFDNELAHRIEAGSDFFLMPSLYEPCGLNQMISMKYGTIPIVRATGGLNDTVEHYDPHSWHGNGFKFTDPTPQALINCVGEAIAVWSQPVLRNKLIKNAMECDFSWDQVAHQYIELYQDTMKV